MEYDAIIPTPDFFVFATQKGVNFFFFFFFYCQSSQYILSDLKICKKTQLKAFW